MIRQNQQESIEAAAKNLERADALLIGAGAGMGVDSGLPDFRGTEGFWKAYPPFKGRSFSQVANAGTFIEDPEQAWGFYGHRMNLYRDTVPHEGFSILLKFIKHSEKDYFIYTSNVDGHFQKAGFDESRVVECHGSLNHLQCASRCGSVEIWSAEDTKVDVAPETFRAHRPLPSCPVCGGLARPNVLMFGDFAWNPKRSNDQENRYEKWLSKHKLDGSYIVAIEFGAGTAIPTVRFECQRQARKLIRVNPREYQIPSGAIALSMDALPALKALEKEITSRR